ncbi:MAG: glycosyltransferase family 2 protein, partial [Elusimicrobiota bacterium]
WHAAHPQREYALLGFVEEFAGDGSEFNMSRLDKVFNPLLNLRELGWEHFYTTHISLKRRFFTETNEWFSRDFPHLAYEDVEMGYRLKRHGLRLFLDPGARGVHEHVMGYDQFMRRAYQTGICLVAFWRLHPELKPYLMSKGMIAARPGMNRIRSWAAAAFLNRGTVGLVERAAKALNRAGFNRPAHFLFRRLFGHHQRGGVEEGLRRYVPGEGRWCPL